MPTRTDLLCACGRPAKLAGDVTLPHGTSARLLLCSVQCATVLAPVTRIDVVVEPEDFGRIMAAPICWCDLRDSGLIVPFCPSHGRPPIPRSER